MAKKKQSASEKRRKKIQLGAAPSSETTSARPAVSQITGMVKNLRIDLDAIANETDSILPLLRNGQAELTLAKRKVQEGRMWLGKVLEQLGNVLPPEYADKANNAKKETRPTRR